MPHSTHQAEVEANPNLVLQQQTSASAASNKLSATAASSSSGGNKVIRKNTKPDLIQRYLAITGRQTLDSRYSKLKVAELKVIVESLERGVVPAEVAITPVISPPVPAVAPHIPVNTSTTDQVMSTFLWTMLQSNPALRDQLLLSIQGNITNLSQSSNSVQVGDKSTERGGDEWDSDDDNTFI